ncbi:hypothetical protein [Cupriavidus sp. TMH.W2]|uniref:hypothetical protein n=1 Tax=Cupriavidus sp. TMH.W2 TaxID=3434465 RepID=UPI003D78A919
MNTFITGYGELIASALRNRGSRKDDFEYDADHHEYRYVIRMCQQLAGSIRANTGKCIDLSEVLRVERMASGHADYQSKFAVYCWELGAGTSRQN